MKVRYYCDDVMCLFVYCVDVARHTDMHLGSRLSTIFKNNYYMITIFDKIESSINLRQRAFPLQYTGDPAWLHAAAKLEMAVHKHSQSPP